MQPLESNVWWALAVTVVAIPLLVVTLESSFSSR